MSAAAKVKNAGRDARGRFKAGVGKVTGNKRTQVEGNADQAVAGVKKTAAKAKKTATKAAAK